MKWFVPVLPLVLFLAATPRARGQSRIACDALKSRILNHSVHYCVYLPDGYDSGAGKTSSRTYPVLYFLHGLGENERMLFSSGGWTLIDDLRQQHKLGEFLIVAPEGGRTFYINSADGKVRYSDFFLQEFMPMIEQRYRITNGRSNRAITGISMGGYGALRFAFAHPELFSAVSAQSAALITETPQELSTAFQSGSSLGGLLGSVFGNPIDPHHWKTNDPLELARKNLAGIQHLEIYFNCGQQDDYGFENGAAALHRELQAEDVKHEYHPYPGSHNFSYFLSHFDEVMEFHSRAFERK